MNSDRVVEMRQWEVDELNETIDRLNGQLHTAECEAVLLEERWDSLLEWLDKGWLITADDIKEALNE